MGVWSGNNAKRKDGVKMVSDKIKGLLALAGKTQGSLAAEYGTSKQAMSNKFAKGSFSLKDAIKIGGFCGAELAFTLPDGQKIVFDSSDLPEN